MFHSDLVDLFIGQEENCLSVNTATWDVTNVSNKERIVINNGATIESLDRNLETFYVYENF